MGCGGLFPLLRVVQVCQVVLPLLGLVEGVWFLRV